MWEEQSRCNAGQIRRFFTKAHWLSQGLLFQLMLNGVCCNFQPCDSADVKELKTEKKDSAHEQFGTNNGKARNSSIDSVLKWQFLLSVVGVFWIQYFLTISVNFFNIFQRSNGKQKRIPKYIISYPIETED